MTLKVYVSGPLAGVGIELIAEYQNNIERMIREACLDVGVSSVAVILPNLAGQNANAEDLVKADQANIRRSDFVVAYPFKSSTGTPMELMYANMIGVPVIVCNFAVVEGTTKTQGPWTRTIARAMPSSEKELRLVLAHHAKQSLKLQDHIQKYSDYKL